MRADRLIRILLLLQSQERLTTKELAQQLEVTERTIHRDMEALSVAGIPVVARRGKYGGWQLMENYRTRLTGLKKEEIMSLFLSPSQQLLKDLGYLQDWTEAREKLIASIPKNLHSEVKDVTNRLHIDSTAWRPSIEVIQVFELLHQAVWDQHKIKIEYERADGTLVTRIVEPLGLVAKGNTWYVVAASEGEIRNYRASRVISAEKLDEPFERPDGFQLASYWQESKQQFIRSLPSYEAQVEVSPDILARLKFTGRFVKIADLKKQEGSWISVKLNFDTEEEAKSFILGFGNQIRVIQPLQLKEQVIQMARSIIDFYNHDGVHPEESKPGHDES
ncbi:helix-turn-helix transcriptional regulator [Paenibacillus gallinarum]|uniref:YafY family transcriptional regulator n=1 Tax=Paenibacillus gallinarum TaxID=2762232 RepID=A0ABR8SVY0_9BACL|nr:YafY family protein [Paenibacillus gallinarum]MBD7967545.1 YafY family transcriptional regulator [Paenibacillus gallinarum]